MEANHKPKPACKPACTRSTVYNIYIYIYVCVCVCVCVLCVYSILKDVQIAVLYFC